MSLPDLKEFTANQLAAIAQSGNTAAFGELVRRHRPRIFAMSFQLMGNEHEADDVCQEVFLKAYQKLSQFQGRSHFGTWLYRIAVNRSIQSLRKRKRRKEDFAGDERIERALAVDAGNDPRKIAELRQTYEILLRTLDELPVPIRTTVILVTLQGLTHSEAASALDCKEGTIAWRIHHARGHLRDALRARDVFPVEVEQRRTSISAELRKLLGSCGYLPRSA